MREAVRLVLAELSEVSCHCRRPITDVACLDQVRDFGGAMLVATFKPSSGCGGRTITFENEQFAHEILGPVSAGDVMGYDRKGWLEWPMDGMRAWVGACAGAPAPDTRAAPERIVDPAPLGFSPSVAAWTARCPACREAALVPGEPKSPFFGGAVRSVWLCPRCQAQFVQKSAPADGGPVTYELKKAGPSGSAVAKRFAKEALTSDEWARVATGGRSDGEIASADLQSFLLAVRDGSTTFRLDGESPVALKRGEFAALRCSDVVLREPRRVTQGVYGGPRVRVAKNLSFNLGAFRAAPHEELHDVDRGELVITSKRYVFMGEKRTVSANLTMIVAVEPYLDAVAIHRSNKQRMEMFTNLDRYGFDFEWEGRSHMASVSGLVVACTIEGLMAGSDAAAPVPRTSSAGLANGAQPRSTVDELERLVRLRDQGAITDEEYVKLKAQIIG